MNLIIALLLWSVTATSTPTSSTDPTLVSPEVLAKYHATYPYMQYGGKLFTFDTEFKWPEGYHRLDSASLTPYQYWVSHMPLWHFQVGVSSLSGDVYQPEQISRAVHLPWRTTKFFDYVIPLQVEAEYLAMLKKEHEWKVLPKAGDTITYDKYLSSDIVYDSRLRLKFQTGELKLADSLAYSKFFDLIASNSSYLSLASNADSVAESQLRPGDFYLGYDSVGTQGRVYVIMQVAQNSTGDKRYIVATGCPTACDFHIPLYHGDRANPWLTMDEVKALEPSKFPFVGFYRLRLPE